MKNFLERYKKEIIVGLIVFLFFLTKSIFKDLL